MSDIETTEPTIADISTRYALIKARFLEIREARLLAGVSEPILSPISISSRFMLRALVLTGSGRPMVAFAIMVGETEITEAWIPISK